MSVTTTEVEVEPFRHFDAEVLAVRSVGASLVRVTFGGEGLRDITTSGPDQRIKVFLPRPGEVVPDVPRGPDWYARYRELAEAERPIMRTYTIRAARDGEIDVDFVRHGDTGPASRWAGVVTPGDRAVLLAPDRRYPGYRAGERIGADYVPPADTGWQVVVGDETALPAISNIVEALPADAAAQVFLEVPAEGDRVDWALPAGVSVTWLVRGSGASALSAAVRAAVLPDGPGYVWLAGESSLVRELRRHFVTDLGVDRKRVCFGGYWRVGRSEDTAHEPDED
ncbi:siderophore-interacting protein [Actinosynnema sp. NPDC047251]|uniref:Siderophore-interacting protein n=1 Tax=Saccharothrix espanaensis (strain ATCC 51144 / DSM 44229 / JCM 9112 / NBRC 15066 / NRRL 15764) TaxID=1179773 RepID=K0K2G6_SACES|nr:siderophore-interacting protein [Saccharothrix espanaensis]CCH31772.1 siderophore-interacting protein [Saccharothrix espanaensis DSM 44229]